MATTEAALTFFMLTQDYDPAHWDWTDTEKESLGDCQATAQVVKERLEGGGCTLEEMYTITHDRDEKRMWDVYNDKYYIKPVGRHIHILGRFEKGGGQTLKEIARLAGVSPEFIEKPKAGKYAYNNMLSYMTHIKYIRKFQYSALDVKTICGKPYVEYYAEHHEAWVRRQFPMLERDMKEVCNEICMNIMKNPNFTMRDIFDDDTYYDCYFMNTSRIDSMFENRKTVMRKKALYEKYPRLDTIEGGHLVTMDDIMTEGYHTANTHAVSNLLDL